MLAESRMLAEMLAENRMLAEMLAESLLLVAQCGVLAELAPERPAMAQRPPFRQRRCHSGDHLELVHAVLREQQVGRIASHDAIDRRHGDAILGRDAPGGPESASWRLTG